MWIGEGPPGRPCGPIEIRGTVPVPDIPGPAPILKYGFRPSEWRIPLGVEVAAAIPRSTPTPAKYWSDGPPTALEKLMPGASAS